jgi:hypothetical protein
MEQAAVEAVLVVIELLRDLQLHRGLLLQLQWVQAEHKILEQMELHRHLGQCQLPVAVTVADGHTVLFMLLPPGVRGVAQDMVM